MKLPSLRNPFFTKPPATYGKVIREQSWKDYQLEKSSDAANPFMGKIQPKIPYSERNDFYVTVGRLQNTVDGIVLDVLNREWHFSDESAGHKYEAQVKMMEKWERDIMLSRWLGNIIRNWCIHGLNFVSPKDWVPIQNSSITGITRDDGGEIVKIWQNVKGTEKPLNARDFIYVPYIELDRQPFPIGMFESVMREFEDIDGKIGKPMLKLYRQAMQDIMKIHHKYASPRVLYAFPGVDQTTIDDDIAPIIESLGPGDRAALNVTVDGEVQLIQETVDGKARFSESLDYMTQEVDTGLQTSKNRIITKPSAMADAREAGSQDDDRVLGIMDLVREFMEDEVIPRVTGLEPGRVAFKWGAKDTFNLEFPEAIEKAIDKNIITTDQARRMLEDQFRWKIPEPTELDTMTPQMPDGTDMPEFPTFGDMPPALPVQRQAEAWAKTKRQLREAELLITELRQAQVRNS